MAKWILFCIFVTLTALFSCYAHPQKKVYIDDHAEDQDHEVEEMSPEEQMQLQVVESTLVEHVLPAPQIPQLSEEVVAEAPIPQLSQEVVAEASIPQLSQEVVAEAPISTQDKFKSGKYTLHKNKRTWAQATEYCRNDNQHLVRIETSLELRTVLAHFTDGVTQVWTDGIGDLQGKKYVWATTGDSVDIDELEVRKENEDVFPKALLLERRGLLGEIQTTRIPFICES